MLPTLLCATALLPGSVAFAQTGVSAVLPNGRAIHPAGNWIPLAPYPFALAVRADGAEIAVPSIGFPFALNVVEQPSGATPAVRRMPAGTYWCGSPTAEVVPSGRMKPSLSSVVLFGKLTVFRVAEKVLPVVQAVVPGDPSTQPDLLTRLGRILGRHS